MIESEDVLPPSKPTQSIKVSEFSEAVVGGSFARINRSSHERNRHGDHRFSVLTVDIYGRIVEYAGTIRTPPNCVPTL
jgi:hypothetical protein